MTFDKYLLKEYGRTWTELLKEYIDDGHTYTDIQEELTSLQDEYQKEMQK